MTHPDIAAVLARAETALSQMQWRRLPEIPEAPPGVLAYQGDYTSPVEVWRATIVIYPMSSEPLVHGFSGAATCLTEGLVVNLPREVVERCAAVAQGTAV